MPFVLHLSTSPLPMPGYRDINSGVLCIVSSSMNVLFSTAERCRPRDMLYSSVLIVHGGLTALDGGGM